MTIRELRNQMGLSQSNFAKYFNVSVANVQHWEQGISSPPEYVPYMMGRILELESMLKKVGES